MFVTELDSFLKKFYQLWSAGQSAHLDVETHAGSAWVGLSVQLGHVPFLPPQHFQPKKKSVSPSRLRRRARRSAERKADIANGAENTKIVEETVTIATAEEAVDNEHERVNETENATAEEVYSKETPDCKEVCENDDCICEPDRNHPSYCKICKSCSRETESEEDLWWHLMNNHNPVDVVDNYDKEKIEEKRYCVRKGSPFSSWFSTPPISQGGFSSKI